MIYLAIWIVGAALTYWLAAREMDAMPSAYMRDAAFRRVRREIALVSICAWPCALAIYLLSAVGAFGDDDDEGDVA